MRNFLLGVLAVLVIGAIAAGAYWAGKNLSPKGEPLVSPAPTTQQPSTPSSSPAREPSAPDDNTLISQALSKKHNWPEGSVTIKVSTNDGQYASGTVTASGGGGYFFAAKVNGVWQIVADGNGVILCSSLTAYPNFPTTLIPECYDQATGKTVKR